jgi:hypothetical protein
MVSILVRIQHQLASQRLIFRRSSSRSLVRHSPLGIIKPKRDLGQRIRAPPLQTLQTRKFWRQVLYTHTPLERSGRGLGNFDTLAVERHTIDARGCQDFQLGCPARLEISDNSQRGPVNRRITHEVRTKDQYTAGTRAEVVLAIPARAAHAGLPNPRREPSFVREPD